MCAVSAVAATPKQLLSAYSSAIVRIVSSCKSGEYQGTGFLIGPQVLLTVRHLAYDPVDASPCAMNATQESSGQSTTAAFYSAWQTTNPGDLPQTDLVEVALNGRLVGHYLQLSTASPRIGATLVALGYPPGKPLHVARGRVTAAGLLNGVPTMQTSIRPSTGYSGGPIVNVRGYVVGLAQRAVLTRGSSGEQALDLARFVHGKPATLCQGSFASIASTVCSTAPAPARPSTIKDCWVSQRPIVDPKSKLFQTGDALPTVYFVERLAHKLRRSLIATLSVVQPNGQPWSPVPARWIWTPHHPMSRTTGPVSWGTLSQVPRGLWTFTATLSDGSSCSYALNLSSP